MSETKVKKMREKKLPVVDENKESTPPIPIKKPRASRAKKVPTKEEALQMLQDTSNELTKIIKDLSEEGVKIKSMNLPRLNELVAETLANLEEDKDEINQKIEEVKSMPEAELSK